jgi:hypothetical protein
VLGLSGAVVIVETTLNAAHVNGCLLIAGLVGLMFESWMVFTFVALVLLGLSLHEGGSRLSGRR